MNITEKYFEKHLFSEEYGFQIKHYKVDGCARFIHPTPCLTCLFMQAGGSPRCF